jgi:hypothetical protein
MANIITDEHLGSIAETLFVQNEKLIVERIQIARAKLERLKKCHSWLPAWLKAEKKALREIPNISLKRRNLYSLYRHLKHEDAFGSLIMSRAICPNPFPTEVVIHLHGANHLWLGSRVEYERDWEVD